MSNPKGISSYWNECWSSYSGGHLFEYEKSNVMTTFTFSFTTILKLSVICKYASMLSFSMHATQKVFSFQQEFYFIQRGNFNKIFVWTFAHEQCYHSISKGLFNFIHHCTAAPRYKDMKLNALKFSTYHLSLLRTEINAASACTHTHTHFNIFHIFLFLGV